MIRLALYLGMATTYAASSLLPQAGVPQALQPTQQTMVVAQRKPHQSYTPVQFNQTPASIDTELHGVVKPSMLADLPSLVAGLIVDVHVKEGEFIKKGTPLVTLDDRVPRARLEAATVEANLMGALDRAKVELKMADSRLSRIRQILNRGAGGNFELEAAEGVRDQAAATVSQQEDVLKAAEATRKLAEAQLHQYTIVAPFDGLVTQIHRKAGTVDPTQIVVTIANLRTLEIAMHVPSRLFGKIRTGNKIPLKASAPVSGEVTATVVSVSPIIDSASDTFRCLLQIDNSQGRLPAGFTVTMRNSQSNNDRLTQVK